MNRALQIHLQTMLKRFSEEIAKREPPGIQRLAAMYACVRLAHKRAREEPEREFWKRYLEDLEAKAAALKEEEESRIKLLDPLAQRQVRQAWRKKAKLLS